MKVHITTGALKDYLALEPESVREAAELVKLMAGLWAVRNPGRMELVPLGMDSLELRFYLSEPRTESQEEIVAVNAEHDQES